MLRVNIEMNERIIARLKLLSDECHRTTNETSTLIQGPSHYLNQSWPKPMSPSGVIRPQWFNTTWICGQYQFQWHSRTEHSRLSLFARNNDSPYTWKTTCQLSKKPKKNPFCHLVSSTLAQCLVYIVMYGLFCEENHLRFWLVYTHLPLFMWNC